MAFSDEFRQRQYYQSTADTYHECHVVGQGEHDLALALLVMLARHEGIAGSFLDVGAGTGRAMQAMSVAFPEADVRGIEPVPELRHQAQLLNGIDGAHLQEGNALNLPFSDSSFDWVMETGVLHHIRDWRQAVTEMVRVSRHGILISDTNNIGQGSPLARKIKKMLKKAGCWSFFVWLQTNGKMSKWSKGDGLYYSFCAFDALPLIRQKFDQIQIMNTGCSSEADLLSSASHVAIVARITNKQNLY